MFNMTGIGIKKMAQGVQDNDQPGTHSPEGADGKGVPLLSGGRDQDMADRATLALVLPAADDRADMMGPHPDARDHIAPRVQGPASASGHKGHGRWALALAIIASGAITGLAIADPAMGPLALPPALLASGVFGQIVALATPLALIWIVYALFVSRRQPDEATELTHLVSRLSEENQRLAHLVEGFALRQEKLAQSGLSFADLSASAADRIDGARLALHSEAETITQLGDHLTRQTAAGRAEIGAMMHAVAQARSDARTIVQSLEKAGLVAHDACELLEGRMKSLMTQADLTRARIHTATEDLTQRLEDLDRVGTGAHETLVATTETLAGQTMATLSQAQDTGTQISVKLDNQNKALRTLVDETQEALTLVGAAAHLRLETQIATLTEQVMGLGVLLEAEGRSADAMLATVETRLKDLDGDFSRLDEQGTVRVERLSEALGTLNTRSQSLGTLLAGGVNTAEGLVGRTEALVTALGAAAREIDDTLPSALSRLDQRVHASRTLIDSTAPEVSRMEREAGAALDRLMEAEAVLASQRETLDQLAETTTRRIERARRELQGFADLLDHADQAASTVAEGSIRSLVDAMVRVRETSLQASARARETLAEVIPAAAAHLADAARTQLAQTLEHEMVGQIARLDELSRAALEAARHAAAHLSAELDGVNRATRAIEARITDAAHHVQEQAGHGFARRAALLIDALNSTSIDMTKILSNEVTDTSWAAYLRGDRGIFTRRAVRLLDAGESRAIQRHYAEQADFREQVSRYIHDFEAMLRDVLSNRDGEALSITLLSSDMGKLYVALAQAIERLRAPVI